MLEFEPFSLPALKNALKYIKKNPSLCSDLSAGYLYMWHEGADVRFCVWNDTFAVRQNIGEQCAFSYPIGADPDGMIDRLDVYRSGRKTYVRVVDYKTGEKKFDLEKRRLQDLDLFTEITVSCNVSQDSSTPSLRDSAQDDTLI